MVLPETPKGNSNVYFRDESSELATCIHLHAPGIRIYCRFKATEETHCSPSEERRNFAKLLQETHQLINITDNNSDLSRNAKQLTSFTDHNCQPSYDVSRFLLTDTRIWNLMRDRFHALDKNSYTLSTRYHGRTCQLRTLRPDVASTKMSNDEFVWEFDLLLSNIPHSKFQRVWRWSTRV